MGQVNLSVRVDEDVKKQFDEFCNGAGMNTSVAVNMFMRAVLRERRIPFEITTDGFYSEYNQKRLEDTIAKVKAGKGMITKTMDELEAMEND